MVETRLILGDCLEVMKSMKDNSIDAVITDPPYGINFSYNQHNDTSDGYGEWIWSAIELAESKCKPGSPIFVWQAMLNITRLAEWFPRKWRIFAACKNFVQMRPIEMQYAFDPVLVWWTDGNRYSKGTLNRDWHVGNTANTLNRKDGNALGHPCARPLDQIKHIVDQWVRPDGIVLDCFMGSGTTGVACVQTGRSFIGIEIDQDYYNIAERRLSEAKLEFGLRLDLLLSSSPSRVKLF